MSKHIEKFAKALDKADVKYTVSDDGDSIFISNSGDNFKDALYMLSFDDKKDDGSSHVFLYTQIVEFTKDNFAKGLITCNELNCKYRWVRFYMDDDCRAVADIDGFIYDDTCADECLDLLVRLAGICDKAYPSFMKALWA